MSDSNKPVEPTPFDVAPLAPPAAGNSGGTAATPGRDTGDGARWVLPGIGVLLLLAALVVFWLPGQIQPQRPAPGDTAAGTPPAAATGAPGDAAVPRSRPAAPDVLPAPWSDAQAARLRKEAQDVLEQLLDAQFALEERGVASWAPERFKAATELAAEGDRLYKERRFEAATARYGEALAALQAIQADIPAELDRLLATATDALQALDGDAAAGALQRAALIEPQQADLPGLQQRLAQLPQLAQLMAAAAAAEAAGDLAAAQETLQRATALDPAFEAAPAELARVTAKAQQQRFNDAMSAGYTALDAGQFEAARKAFRAAAQVVPGSPEAASALLEVDTVQSARRLGDLEDKARRLEAAEQWQQAQQAYEQALAIDSTVLFATEGLARSAPRAELAQQLQGAIDEPQRLADEAVAAQMARLLARAQQITPRGAALQAQIDTLDRLLRQANTPVAVTLQSDGATEVTVYKVARLGSFTERTLELRPGTYTAVGSRRGYRDVRRSFTVEHGTTAAPVTIICTEPI